MLDSCANTISVVNIDNEFMARRILRSRLTNRTLGKRQALANKDTGEQGKTLYLECYSRNQQEILDSSSSTTGFRTERRTAA